LGAIELMLCRDFVDCYYSYTMMFNRILSPCCKDYVCDCCLTDDEIITKHINKDLKQWRRQNLHERKLLLLGDNELLLLFLESLRSFFSFCLGNAEAGK